jgi:hypothetical protein
MPTTGSLIVREQQPSTWRVTPEDRTLPETSPNPNAYAPPSTSGASAFGRNPKTIAHKPNLRRAKLKGQHSASPDSTAFFAEAFSAANASF